MFIRLRRIFLRVFLKKRKKTRGRRSRSLRRQSDRAIPSVTTSNTTTLDITDYYNSNTFNNNNILNNNNNANSIVNDNENKLVPPVIPSTPNRSSSGQRRDWRSGHKPIDDLIQEIRLEFPHPAHNLTWIPFDEFVNCKPITRGGYSAIYEAMWTKSGQIVALKCFDGSQDFSSDFLNEIKTHWGLYSQPQFLRCYGITQLQNGEFMMVMQYASFGDLRLHLQRNRISSWKDKIRILKQIARGLAELHKRDLIHGDLHSGNIMNIDQSHFVIGDVGLCGPANRMVRKKGGVYGVLPYVAPELLRGADYSKKADIYSFAIIMWEICSGIRPYAGTAHNLGMAKDICEGKRPPVPPGTPSFYSELMKSCWDVNPNNRPDAPEVLKTVYHWLVNDSLEDYLRKGGSTILFNNSNNLTHPEATYYSRLLDFPELRERKQVLSSRGPEYKTSNLQNSSVEENNNNNNYSRPSLIQENFTQSPQGTLNNSQLKLRTSRETLESKISQNTYTSKQSRSYNKPQDTPNPRSVPIKSSQRASGKPSQRKYNSNSPKQPNYSRPSQNSSYSNATSQTTLRPPQRSPISPSQFYESARSVKSDDSVSINSRTLGNPLSVIIPDDDVETLTSFWSMDGPNLKG
ncbi:hypothetical protein RclHR1_02380014 [Rhizophagus clarus]|uniref:Protein kinase domain-containing protein n=1 Tax=Rhizophagus clarus TaxID=94130 RepID=A0A2Z6QY96_9GLOM|nr:hypothetical protein RclHR1_02380014 [Rhizophagus clarus]